MSSSITGSRDDSANGFRALRVHKCESGIRRGIETLPAPAPVPLGHVRVQVQYSSLNYKDALSATGSPGVTKHYPHTPGIDAAGIVIQCDDPRFKAGDKVLITGFDLGMNTDGGFGELVTVPMDWVVPLPQGMTARTAMIYGTAGFTAALALGALTRTGLPAKSGPLIVTGASGGVGSCAVALAAERGWEVHAVSGKPGVHESLRALGAAEVLGRDALLPGAGVQDNAAQEAAAQVAPASQLSKPLLPVRAAAAVDTVGGAMLAQIVKCLQPGGAAAACGLVGGTELPLTVLPFILRGVSLLGIDSQSYPREHRSAIWEALAKSQAAAGLEGLNLVQEIELDELNVQIERILSGGLTGRVLVRHATDE